jgi:hypothetical protein
LCHNSERSKKVERAIAPAAKRRHGKARHVSAGKQSWNKVGSRRDGTLVATQTRPPQGEPLREPQIVQFAISQRRKGVRRVGNPPFPSSRFALPLFVLNCDQAHHRLLPASNDDLLAPASPLNQPRKLGLGLANGDSFHDQTLANFTQLSQRPYFGSLDGDRFFRF